MAVNSTTGSAAVAGLERRISEHLEPALFRHQQIQYEKIRRLRIDQRECLLAARGFVHDMAVLTKGPLGEGADVGVVVHHEDADANQRLRGPPAAAGGTSARCSTACAATVISRPSKAKQTSTL